MNIKKKLLFLKKKYEYKKTLTFIDMKKNIKD